MECQTLERYDERCNICIGFIEKNNIDIDKIKNYLNKHKNN